MGIHGRAKGSEKTREAVCCKVRKVQAAVETGQKQDTWVLQANTRWILSEISESNRILLEGPEQM